MLMQTLYVEFELPEKISTYCEKVTCFKVMCDDSKDAKEVSRMRMSEDLFLEAEMVIVKDIGNENQFTLFNPTEETVKLVLDWRHSGTIKMVHVKDCDGEDSVGYCGVIAGTLKQHRSNINRVVMFNTFEER